ncbi:MAG: hypothetical protein NTW07_09395 [candidate division Zixibacteria bacterium]|nr:hypothetical protein [candidate division Zixibacteria bacterium]
MKKIILGIFLLVLLVAVSYFQFTRQSAGRTKAYRKGYHAGADSVQVAQPDFDSLAGLLTRERQALAQYQDVMADSLGQIDSLRQHSVDSLERVISKQDSDISRLKRQTLAKKSPSKSKLTIETPVSKGPSHEEILGYYKQAMSKLPSDLTDYEFRVSVDEIRTETAAKFSITVESLNQIRADNNVDF